MRTKRPNVMFLFTDDQRHDMIGALGSPHVQTPFMDRLADLSGQLRRLRERHGDVGPDARSAALAENYGK
jgi:hypothetical protein